MFVQEIDFIILLPFYLQELTISLLFRTVGPTSHLALVLALERVPSFIADWTKLRKKGTKYPRTHYFYYPTRFIGTLAKCLLCAYYVPLVNLIV